MRRKNSSGLITEHGTRAQEQAMLPIRTILHPTDFSEHSGYAFQVASSLARELGARLIVLHVAPRDPFDHARETLLDPRTYALEARLREFLRPELGIPIEPQLRVGDVVTGILRVAAETPCDLIVLGSRARRGWDRLLLGSVADVVWRRACCPVLIAKDPPSVTPVPLNSRSERIVKV